MRLGHPEGPAEGMDTGPMLRASGNRKEVTMSSVRSFVIGIAAYSAQWLAMRLATYWG
jgi:hypothetical protein